MQANNNGMVPDIQNNTYENGNSPFLKMFSNDVIPNNPKNVNVDFKSLTGKLEKNQVNTLFFSSLNIEALQDSIRYQVFKKSNGKFIISRQSVMELLIIIRSIYITHSKNLPYNVLEQVRDLNAHVLNYCIPQVYSARKFHETYLKDKSELPVPLDHGVNTSSKGDKVYEFKGYLN